MSKFREKAEAQTEEIIGQMLGDELLVKKARSGRGKRRMRQNPPRRDQVRQGSGIKRSRQRHGSGHRPRRARTGAAKDKARAQQVSRVDKGGDPPGKKA